MLSEWRNKDRCFFVSVSVRLPSMTLETQKLSFKSYIRQVVSISACHEPFISIVLASNQSYSLEGV